MEGRLRGQCLTEDLDGALMTQSVCVFGAPNDLDYALGVDRGAIDGFKGILPEEVLEVRRAGGPPEQLFDAGVLHGPGTAGRWLQNSLNQNLGTNLKVDGKVGPDTRAAIAQAIREGKIQAVNDSMVDKRLRNMRNDKTFKFNKGGWVSRANKFRLGEQRPQVP